MFYEVCCLCNNKDYVSQIQSHSTTDNQSASPSWCEAHVSAHTVQRTHRPQLFDCCRKQAYFQSRYSVTAVACLVIVA
jgi:hypothetical protein